MMRTKVMGGYFAERYSRDGNRPEADFGERPLRGRLTPFARYASVN